MRKGMCITSAVLAFVGLMIFIPLQSCNKEAAFAFGKSGTEVFLEGLLIGGMLFFILICSFACISTKKIIVPILLSSISLILIVVLLIANNIALVFPILIHFSAGIIAFLDINNTQNTFNQNPLGTSYQNKSTNSSNTQPIMQRFQGFQQNLNNQLQNLNTSPSLNQFSPQIVWQTSNNIINSDMCSRALSTTCKDLSLDFELLKDKTRQDLEPGKTIFYRTILVYNISKGKIDSSISNSFHEYYLRNLYKLILQER